MADMIPTADMEYWLKTGTSTYTKLENLKDLSPSADKATYERKYKDRTNTSDVVTSIKYAIEAEVELEESGALHAFLEANEDALNVATEVILVKKFRPAVPAWATATEYVLGDQVIGDAKIYTCTTAGTSDATEPTWPNSGTVTDGAELVWTYASAQGQTPVGADGSYGARKAAFVLNVDPIDGAAGEFLAAKFVLGRTDEAWAEGTFDTATATFTPAS